MRRLWSVMALAKLGASDQASGRFFQSDQSRTRQPDARRYKVEPYVFALDDIRYSRMAGATAGPTMRVTQDGCTARMTPRIVSNTSISV